MIIPEIIRLKGTNSATKPNDWKNISEIKLPRKPRTFFITVFSGKIKFGSSGEKSIKETSNKMPVNKIPIPAISITLFIPKFIILLANFLNSINQ